MTFNIYGIGNALVDTEIKITDQILTDLGIDKGVMTLIEDDELNRLQTHFKYSDQAQACGGSVANSMIGASQMGAHCYFSSKIANDNAGSIYHRDLIDQGIQTNLNQTNKDSNLPTGTCMVLVTPDAERTMCTYLGETSHFSKDHLSLDSIGSSDWILLEGYLATSPAGVELSILARETAQESNTKVAISLSDPNITAYFNDQLHDMIGPSVDLIFCNEDEALGFTKTDSIEDAQAKLQGLAETVVITRGKNGALILTDNDTLTIEGNSVDAIDTLGAGDCFAGSFLSAITQGYSTQDAGKIACFASSVIVTQYGPRLKSNNVKKVTEFISKLA